MKFGEYWRLQFRDIKYMRGIPKLITMLVALNPFIMHTMWLYDTGRITPDERFMEK